MAKLEHRKYSGAEILLPQAVAAYEAQNYELAEKVCLRLLEKEPDNADAHNLMCLLFLEKKMYMVAIRHIAKAIEKETDRAQFHANLAKALLELKEYDKTLMAYDKTLSLRPDWIDAYITKASVYKEQGDVETGKQLYQQALSIAPENEQLHNLLGNTLSELGAFDEAMDSFKTALQINPNSAQAYTNIATVSTNAIDAKDIGLMESLFNGEELRKEGKISLGFGLGKEYEKAGDYDKAFHYFSAANNLMRKDSSFVTTQEMSP